MSLPQSPYEYWNVRLAIICVTAISLIALDLYAAANHVTTLPITINSLLSVIAVVLSTSALTRGGPPTPPAAPNGAAQ